ncbi:helix-turn-helix domain-containing protein [Spongiimicrobium sp. 2-473A-2-J]|uniref:helix-turn-helix domain-containing protein n=1 Tax=Eudoraea algarum TaxID=3417568 RepID=UPI003D36A28F
MHLIFIVASSVCLLLAVLILSKRHNNIPNTLLGIWLLLTAIEFTFQYGMEIEIYLIYPHILGVLDFFPLLHTSLLYIYVLAIVNDPFKKTYFLFLIPFFIGLIASIPFFVLGGDTKIELYTGTRDRQLAFQNTTILILAMVHALIVASYLVLSLIKLNTYLIKWRSQIRSLKNNGLFWLRNLVLGYLVLWSIVAVSTLTNMADLQNTGLLVFAVFMIALGYLGLKRTHLFVQSTPISDSDTTEVFKYQDWNVFTPYAHSGLKEETAKVYLNRLEAYMKSDTPYLNPKLTLTSLSDQLDISSNHLSQIINERLRMNFSDYINSYRVKEFKDRITSEDSKKYTVLGLALECGFNSKSSFNNVFKKLTGETPTSYISATRGEKVS